MDKLQNAKQKAIRILYFDNKWLEWFIRILFTYNLVMLSMKYDDTAYPAIVLALILISFWFMSFRLKVIAIPFLLMAAFVNLFHMTPDQLYNPNSQNSVFQNQAHPFFI
jgi:hypothetical protein